MGIREVRDKWTRKMRSSFPLLVAIKGVYCDRCFKEAIVLDCPFCGAPNCCAICCAADRESRVKEKP